MAAAADAAAAEPAARSRRNRGERSHETRRITSTARTAGPIELSDDIFGIEPRADILARWSTGSSPSAAPAPTRCRPATRSRAPARRCTSRRAPAAPVTARARAPQFLGGGRAFGPVVRSHALRPAQEGARAGAAPRPVVQGQGRRPRSCWTRPSSADAEDRGAAGPVRQARPEERPGHRRRRGRGQLRPGRPQHPEVDVLPNAGLNVYDVLRRDKLVLTRAAIEAIEARFAERRPPDARRAPLRHHPRPGDHRKGHARSPSRTRWCSSVAKDATKDEIAAAVEELFKVKVTKVNTLIIKGKTKRFRGRPRPAHPTSRRRS